MNDAKVIDQVHTKLVGGTFNNEDGINRQTLICYCKKYNIKTLRLVREISPYDKNAIRVEAIVFKPQDNSTVVKDGSLINVKTKNLHLGYIRNNEVKCIVCGESYKNSNNVPEQCKCGSYEFRREGLATTLSMAIDRGIKYNCEVVEYTGGSDHDQKYHGVNLKIFKV